MLQCVVAIVAARCRCHAAFDRVSPVAAAAAADDVVVGGGGGGGDGDDVDVVHSKDC